MKKDNRRSSAPEVNHPTNPHEAQQAFETDMGFFARYTDRSFRFRLFNFEDLRIANSHGFYYGPPNPGMCRVVLVRQVYEGILLYAVGQVNDDADLDMSETLSRTLYMAVATPERIKIGDEMEALAKILTEKEAVKKEEN
jgi:hypothetical protein